MLDWISTTISGLGYGGILVLMLLETVLPPIPSELIMPLAGFTVTQGKLNFIAVVIAGALGSILGALPWYYLGKTVGATKLRGWLDRYGKWVRLSGADLDRSRQWFSRYGGAVVFFGRLIPGIRTYISIPAGLEVMPLSSFLLFSSLGTVLWVLLLTAIGYGLGDNYQAIAQFLRPISSLVLITLFGSIGLWLVYHIYRQRQPQPPQ